MTKLTEPFELLQVTTSMCALHHITNVSHPCSLEERLASLEVLGYVSMASLEYHLPVLLLYPGNPTSNLS